MTAVYRTFNRGFFVVFALTGLLWLAGIILLPALGPPYADPAQAQTEPVDEQVPLGNRSFHGTVVSNVQTYQP